MENAPGIPARDMERLWEVARLEVKLLGTSGGAVDVGGELVAPSPL